MCTNYRPTSRELVAEYFGAPAPSFEFRDEVYPGHEAPIIRRGDANDSRERLCTPAIFGLIPIWSKDGKNYRHTYNARTETVYDKPSYRNAWRKRQFCIVPMMAFYEPCYTSGKPVRWRIERHDQRPFGVAAIYDFWKSPDGEWVSSYSLLTVNADDHPVMGQFHPVGDEKRSIIAIPSEFIDDWLHASTDQATTFFAPIPADEFTAQPDPKPAREKSPQ